MIFLNVFSCRDGETCPWVQAQVLWGCGRAQGAGARKEQRQTDGGPGEETQADRGGDWEEERSQQHLKPVNTARMLGFSIVMDLFKSSRRIIHNERLLERTNACYVQISRASFRIKSGFYPQMCWKCSFVSDTGINEVKFKNSYFLFPAEGSVANKFKLVLLIFCSFRSTNA